MVWPRNSHGSCKSATYLLDLIKQKLPNCLYIGRKSSLFTVLDLSKRKITMQTMQKETSDCWEVNNYRLSELPGDVFLSILSYLPLKDVVRTSVVSHKWQHMWRYVPNLQFEDIKATHRMSARPNKKFLSQERTKFVSLVNRVLDRHLASRIHEFKINFNLENDSCQDHIDKWVKFALSKQVKILEVDFIWKTTPDTVCSTLHLDFINISTTLALTCFTLSHVNITGKQIENLLLCCPFLENLCIKHSDIMTGVSICGSSLPLKHLEISRCIKFETMDISAPKLISFTYVGFPITLRVFHAPLLSKVAIGMNRNPVWYAFNSLANYFSQLEEFDLAVRLVTEANLRINHVPALPKLKHLRLRFSKLSYQSCLGWAPLIEASPLLEKLSLDMSFCPHSNPKMKSKHEGCPLKSLKTLELRARSALAIDLELISYVFNNAIVLKDVVMYPYYEHVKSIPKVELVELEKLLPPSVKLTIK